LDAGPKLRFSYPAQRHPKMLARRV
jgi:hypothetical protein